MGDMFSGDSRAPSTNESTAQRIQAESTYLPQLLKTLSGQIQPTEQAIQSASNVISPQEQALNAQLYQQYSPQYAAADRSTDLASIQGAGGQAALEAQALQRQIDPEYYATRSAMGSKLGDLINNPISGSESAAIERANNRNQIAGGTYNLGNGSDRLSAAMNFGQAGRDRLGQALSLATQSMPAMKSGTDTFAQATGRGGTQNAITGNQLGNTNMGQSAFGTGNQMAGQIAGLQGNEQNINANRRTMLDFGNQTVGSVCCWIFLEAYYGKLPRSVRLCRDYFYNKEPRLAEGYRRMAKWIVPLMKFKVIRKLVWHSMVKPITSYGEYLTGKTNKSKGYQNFKFWSMIWRTI